MRSAAPLALVVSTVILSGCGTFTGIPSHGGGKRFAVEQELIAASARSVAKDIDITPLVGKKIALYVISIGDEGSGNLVGGRYSWEAALRGDYVNAAPTRSTIIEKSDDPSRTRTRTDSAIAMGDIPVLPNGGTKRAGGGVSYEGPGSYTAEAFMNPRDAMFLQGVIIEAFTLRGAIIVASDRADIDVYVTVDVFGTERSRTEMHAYNRESLVAKTAIEVVAFDREGHVVLPPASSSFEAEYREEYIFWIGPFAKKKIVRRSNDLLVDFHDLTGPKGGRPREKVGSLPPPPVVAPTPGIERTRPKELTIELPAPDTSRPEDVQKQEEAPLGPPRPVK